MTSLEYILKLFEVSAKQLHIDYVEETPTRLQKWATKNKPPFIALVNESPSFEINDDQKVLDSFDMNIVFIADNIKDPSTKQLKIIKQSAYRLGKEFFKLVNKNQDITLSNVLLNKEFRSSSFLGIGYGATFTISIGDQQDYCDIFCNDSTKTIDCNS